MRKKEKSKEEKPKKKRRMSFSTVILVLILLTGVGIMLYPTVSDWWNSLHASRAIAGYVEAVEELSEEEKEAIFSAAESYNRSRPYGANFNLSNSEYAEYEKLLNVAGNGIMGYIQIPSINVNLPVYHGTDEAVLQIAVGHIAGSSLPVGGERTHAVASGHRGLPSAKLFTDLDRLKEGDIFTFTVLDRTLTYQVDQIRITLPEDTEELAIAGAEDYFTLITCTPYGINTHRILVRGHRVATSDDTVPIVAEAVKIPPYLVVPAVAIPMLFIVLAVMLVYYRKSKLKKTEQEILDDLKKQ